MSPILDSIGSVKAFGWGKILSSTAFESIASVTVGSGGSANVTFSSIPGTYTHLQLRGFVANNSTNCNFYMSFNGNTATNGHAVFGEGANPVSYDNSSPGLIYGMRTNTGQFVFITDLLDYTNANKNKTIRTLAGGDANGAGRVGLYSGFINNTAAITSLSIAPNTGNFPQYSVVSLYGIKGA